ncbi:hypothetical protein H9P43_009073 [Blastocladiella emersonii ATCC 22665]|nr:hypothetical protein H9P43_009073 [Blastocladiella emersonii ATCC 22665]
MTTNEGTPCNAAAVRLAYPAAYAHLDALVARFAAGPTLGDDLGPLIPPSAVLLLVGATGTGKSYLLAHLAKTATVVVLDNVASLYADPDLAFAADRVLARLRDEGNAQVLVAATARESEKVPRGFRAWVTDTVTLTPPDTPARAALASLYWPTASPADLASLAAATHGWVHADLAALFTRLPLTPFWGLPAVLAAASALTPSATSATPDPIPTTSFSDLGGLASAKSRLLHHLVWPSLHPAAFSRLGVPSRTAGVLLYGPPGTGKTHLARAVAGESQAAFAALSIPDLVRPHVGESEKAIARLDEWLACHLRVTLRTMVLHI